MFLSDLAVHNWIDVDVHAVVLLGKQNDDDDDDDEVQTSDKY